MTEPVRLEIMPISAAETLDLRLRVLGPTDGTSRSLVFDGDDAPETLHVGIRREGDLVAVGSIIRDPLPPALAHLDWPGERTWRIRGMAVADGQRGRGMGRRILQRLEGHAAHKAAVGIWCNARVPAVGLYARASYSEHGPVFDIPGAGPHVVMYRKLEPFEG